MEELRTHNTLKRVLDGQFRCVYAGRQYAVRDIPLLEQLELDEKYKADLKEGLAQGLLDENTALRIAIQNGVWDEQWSLDRLKKQMTLFQGQMRVNKHNLGLLASLKAKYEELKKEHGRIEDIYNVIMNEGTARYFALRCKLDAMVQMQFPTISAINDDVLWRLYKIAMENTPNTSEIRAVARGGVWTTIYRGSKDHLLSIFTTAQALTTPQHELLHWSQVYEYVYNHHERPDSDIIASDELLDKWLEEDNKKSAASRKNDKAKKEHNEVWHICDREGAKKVYEMNDEKTRKEMQRRQAVIAEKGVVTERDLLRRS